MAHQVGTKKDLNTYNIHNWIYRLHIYIYWTLIELRLSAPQKLGGGELSPWGNQYGGIQDIDVWRNPQWFSWDLGRFLCNRAG
jgi:hypothetical protein